MDGTTAPARQTPVAVEQHAPERIEPDASTIMEESIKLGALLGGVPLLACAMTHACTPDALLAGAALLIAGAVAGVIVGAGRVIAARTPRPPPEKSKSPVTDR